MQIEQIRRIYSRYSSLYDTLFGQMFWPRIKLGLEKLNIRPGDRIIEVGVGTGISLPLYPPLCRVIGIDITRKMLDKAKEKKERYSISTVELIEMDAQNLAFKDDSFDHAIMPFVISVVPDPERMVFEIKRVTRRGGNIVIINHFCSDNPVLFKIGRFITPFSIRLGWRSDLKVDLISNHCNLHIQEILKKRRLDPWLIIHAINRK